MGEHPIDTSIALAVARAALPAAALTLPTSVLIGSDVLEALAVLLFVTGAVMLDQVLANRLLRRFAALALAAAIATQASLDEPFRTLLVCVASVSLLIAWRTAMTTRPVADATPSYATVSA